MRHLATFLICLVIIGCGSMKPQRTVDPSNVFVSNYPELKLKISENLKYIGDYDTAKVKDHKYGMGQARYSNEYHYFVDADGKKVEKAVVILIQKIKDNSIWLPIDFKRTLVDQYPQEICGKYWQICVKTISPDGRETQALASLGYTPHDIYLGRVYSRRTGQDKMLVSVLYLEDASPFKREIKKYYRVKKLTKEQTAYIEAFLDRAEKAIRFLP